MKKYTGFLALAAIAALPACSGQNGHNYHSSQDQNGRYQYTTDDESKAVNENKGSEHKDWKEKKLDVMVDDFFAKADTNHDDSVSWKEFQAFMHKKFREADKNRDGMLTRDEVKEMLRRHMERIHEKMRDESHASNRDDNSSRSENMRSDNGYDNIADNRDAAGDTENPSRYNPQE